MENELKEKIKGLFNHYVPGIPNCGTMVFEADYEDMKEDFQPVSSIEQKQKFMDLFYELHILQKDEAKGGND